MQCGKCHSRVSLFKNITCGYSCGCVFQTSCVKNESTCPIHGSSSSLRILGSGKKCLIQLCKGSLSDTSICSSCEETVISKITTVFDQCHKPNITWRELFESLFVNGNTSLWPPFCVAFAQSHQAQVSLCVDAETGELNTVRLDGKTIEMPTVMAVLWKDIVLLLSKISSVIIYDNFLWYAPLFLFQRLDEKKIALYTVQQLLDGTSIPVTDGLIHAFRCWIRTHGRGSHLVKICSLPDGSCLYRKITKHNVLSKENIQTLISNKRNGILITELYGEHPLAAEWIDELVAEKKAVVFSNFVFECVEQHSFLPRLTLSVDNAIPILSITK